MRLFNPTPEDIMEKFSGVGTMVFSGKFVQVTDERGKWLLDKSFDRGMVDVTDAASAPDPKLFIAKKAIEGLEAYKEMCGRVIQSFIDFDTELKTVNHYGTILEHPRLRVVRRNIEQAQTMVLKIQDQYGISIKKEDDNAKIENLFRSIDSAVEEFHSDKEAQEKARQQEASLAKDMSEISDFYSKGTSGFDPKSVGSTKNEKTQLPEPGAGQMFSAE